MVSNGKIRYFFHSIPYTGRGKQEANTMYIVTGAAGFIGSAMVWELNQAGITDILCVDEFANSSKWKNLVKCQFTDFINKNELFIHLEGIDPQEIDAIIHLGACADTTETDMDYLLINNYVYSIELATYCEQHNIKYIYASSGATYGDGKKGFTENVAATDLVPLNQYGYSKVLFDRYMEKAQPKNQWVGMRFFNVYGPQEYHKDGMASLVYKAYHQIKDTNQLKLFRSEDDAYKDGEQMRDFVYVKDITNWIMQLIKNDSISGIFNMGSGKARTWLDLAQAIFSAMNKEMKIEWIEMPDSIKNQYQYFTEADMQKIKTHDIGNCRFSMEDGVGDYIKNYLLKEDIYL